MKNRIPPERSGIHINLARPGITNPNLVLTVNALGWLIFQWVTPGGLFYQESYHVNNHRRVSWRFSKDPIEN